jgi:FtsZ-interacting cell division protein YlmF
MQQLIGSNPLYNSIQAQGYDPNILMGMSPSVPNFQPDLQVPPEPQMPNRSMVAPAQQALNVGTNQPQTQQPSQQAPQTTQAPTNLQNLGIGTNQPAQPKKELNINPNIYSEAQQIIQALTDRLAHHNKMEGKNVK